MADSYEEIRFGGGNLQVERDSDKEELLLVRSVGKLNRVAAAFVRPADTTAYTAKDAIGISLAITAATNATPIVITVGTNTLTDGEAVTIAAVGGNTNANGNRFVKKITSTTFALYLDKTLETAIAGNASYTSGGTLARLFRLPALMRVAYGTGYITKIQLFTDKKDYVGQVKVHFFTNPVTAILDNSPYLKLYANKDYRAGECLLPACSTEDSSSSTMASALAVVATANANLPLPISSDIDGDVYFMLEDTNGNTPTSGQNFELVVTVDGN